LSAKTEPALQDQMAELDQLLAWFDRPDVDLDEALKKFDEGVKLTEKLKKRLEALENKIIVLKERFDQDGI
jgi:exodeoxyribonuclease VII small subunit